MCREIWVENEVLMDALYIYILMYKHLNWYPSLQIDHIIDSHSAYSWVKAEAESR